MKSLRKAIDVLIAVIRFARWTPRKRKELGR